MISEDIVRRARRYCVQQILVKGTVAAVTRGQQGAEAEDVGGGMLFIDMPALPGFDVVLPQLEIPIELHSVLAQLVGQELTLILKRVSGKTAYASYVQSLKKQRPIPVDGTACDGVVRAVIARNVFVEACDMVHVIPRRFATRSRVERLPDIYKPGQKVLLRQSNTDVEIVVKDPWDNLVIRQGDIVAGTVIDTFPDRNFVLIEVEPGLQGIANMPLRGCVARGDRVSAYVASVRPEERRLRLRVSRKLAVAAGDAW